MELNALFLPLLGGFLFYFIFHGTQYIANRRSRAVMVFWCATIGVMLLVFARVVTMAAQWGLNHKSPIGSALLAFTAPPIVFCGVLGLGLQGMTHYLTKTLFAEGARAKQIAGIVLAVLGTWYLITVYRDGETLAVTFLGRHRDDLMAIWWLVVMIFTMAAVVWSQVITISLGAMMLRGAFFFLGLVEATGIAFEFAEPIKGFWTSLTLPLGDTLKPEAIGAASLACALGPVMALGLNLLYPRAVAASRHFESQWINGFEDLIYTANRRGQLIMLTLTDRKVYIGLIQWVPPHPEAPDAFVQIVPYFSGYRTARNHKLKLTTSYASVYKGLSKSEIEQFRKVIPIAKIIIAGEFDLDHYGAFPVSAKSAPKTTRRAAASGRRRP